jgi:addiction module HigA family antidote
MNEIPNIKMVDPPHIGVFLRNELIDHFNLTVEAAANALAVARPGFNNLLNGKRGLSYEMALKIEAAFGIDAALLAGMQHEYEMAQALKRRAELTRGIKRVAAPAYA